MTDEAEAMLPAAAALAVAVADYDAAAVADVLKPLEHRELHALCIALAANVDLDAPLTADIAELTPRDIATRAINIAAELFYTESDAILARTRDRRNVSDARAVAMYACRLVGLSSTYTGRQFNRDHSTVLYSCTRVGEDPRLRGIGKRIAAQCGWARGAIEEESA